MCAHLKADDALKDIPVIFISAMTETLDKVKAFSVGGVDYVTKPFQFEEVHARVEAHLRIHFLQRQLSEHNENLELPAALEAIPLKGYRPLLKKALKSAILLAASFSKNKQAAQGTAVIEEQALRVRLNLDALSLSDEQVADFFNIESQARSASSAETLGLAPVVAHQIITAFGGEMRLVKSEGNNGTLEAIFPQNRSRRQSRWPVLRQGRVIPHSRKTIP